jgi:hypothetical protein
MSRSVRSETMKRISIYALLATVVVVVVVVLVHKYVQSRPAARVMRTTTCLFCCRTAAGLYATSVGAPPPDLQCMTDPARNPMGLLYIEEESIIDAWGTSIRYTSTGTNMYFTSAGPDGKFGTQDDIQG